MVVGPLGADEKPFKPYEPVFAVIQIGSHQFKVSNGDSIFTERLKFCDVIDMPPSGKTEEEKVAEATEIGYKVVGRLGADEKPFKPYEPVFAIVQISSHLFKVSNGDSIFTERLKFCDVNDKLILNRVLMLGSQAQTVIGRPILPDAAVHAVVEEHALDAKKKRHYRSKYQVKELAGEDGDGGGGAPVSGRAVQPVNGPNWA
ncbi:hypothetical protein E2562_031061 [Oryza meyeriana var. granulata]|uniref:Large ribosomal subunit protein bL21m n=1 Tax=Oryza meyeriana var. granulata TaxID=110450 RepID=A0A6G1E588_9ORYZ|nr:hypothetical protein E2562_031061 [Oryza meyeriana var. granulata]